MHRALFLPAAALALAPAASLAQSAEFLAKAKELTTTYADSVVGVEGVLAINAKIMGQVAQQQEQEVSTSAVVVSAEGHLIASLSSLDPSETMNGRTIDVGGNKQTLEVEAELSDLKIYLQDGTSYDARTVLRDPQSDLVLLQLDDPDSTSHTWQPVPLAAAAPAPALLDEVLLLGRHDADLDRSVTTSLSTIEALVERPRPLYVPQYGLPSRIVFNAAGDAIGLSVQQIGSPGSQMPGTLVIQPAAEIQRLIDQAAEAPETTPEPPADDSDEDSADDTSQPSSDQPSNPPSDAANQTADQANPPADASSSPENSSSGQNSPQDQPSATPEEETPAETPPPATTEA